MYAGTLGVVLVALAVAGFVVADRKLFGAFPIGDAVVHLAIGGLLFASAWRPQALGGSRVVVGWVGASSIGVALLGFLSNDMFGVLPSDQDWNVAHNASHLVIGLESLLIVAASRGPRRRSYA